MNSKFNKAPRRRQSFEVINSFKIFKCLHFINPQKKNGGNQDEAKNALILTLRILLNKVLFRILP